MRAVFLIPFAAAPIAAASLFVAAPAPAPAAETDPDALCARYLGGEEESTEGFVTVGPATVSGGVRTEQVIVTGRQIARPNLTSPMPVTVIGGSSIRPSSPPRRPRGPDRERYAGKEVATVQSVAAAPVSTFSVDVDTGSYANVRRLLNRGVMPPQAAVRTEEMLNYFRYDYPAPQDRSRPFTIATDLAATPWNGATRLLRIGLRGYDVSRSERPAANLVFLVDVSGSMEDPEKLPLVKCSLALLARQLTPRDRVSIVVYAGAAGRVLDPTSDPKQVIGALRRLQAGGSTAGAEGIQLAYRTARENRLEGGINRVILATDGDFNVGVSDNDALVDMVEREREAGITLTTLGFGSGNYNEAMMEQIADHGNGNYSYIDTPREAQKVLAQELSSTLFTIAKDVKIQIEFNPAYVSEYRLVGYENRTLNEQDFDNDKVDAGDIGAGHQVTALYELVPAGAKGWRSGRHFAANRVAARGREDGQLAWLRLRYKLPGGGASRLIEQPVPAALVDNAGPPRGDTAWAAAVAAFGQKLRGDPWLGSFGYGDARRLAQSAGIGGDYWRGEFLRLATLAEQRAAGAPRSGAAPSPAR
jgi:Ca-activated chloride channel family protein